MFQVGRQENAIGWYHSHPGYGCWLSGIDVSTQMLNQNFQEPFVAIVIDPVRTISAGKVCLGAFRTYPKVWKHLLTTFSYKLRSHQFFFICLIFSGLQTSQRRTFGVPNNPVKQNRRLWRALQTVLFVRGDLLQVLLGQEAFGLVVEQVLGEHTQFVKPDDKRGLHNWPNIWSFRETRTVRWGVVPRFHNGRHWATRPQHRREISQSQPGQLQNDYRSDSWINGPDHQGPTFQSSRKQRDFRFLSFVYVKLRHFYFLSKLFKCSFSRCQIDE